MPGGLAIKYRTRQLATLRGLAVQGSSVARPHAIPRSPALEFGGEGVAINGEVVMR